MPDKQRKAITEKKNISQNEFPNKFYHLFSLINNKETILFQYLINMYSLNSF